MTQPSFVPITDADQVRNGRALAVPRHWAPRRPGDLRAPGQPRGARFGTPGPDQGFALRLARRFVPRLHLTKGEDVDDVVTGCALLAARRAGLFGRAPSITDVEVAFAVFGFLVADPPGDLVAARRKAFRSVSHGYAEQRALVDSVPEETLRLSLDEVRARLGDWRSLLAI